MKKVPDGLRNQTIVMIPKTSLAPLGLVRQLARCNGALEAVRKPIEIGSLLQLVGNRLEN